jgi:hypothetical protein
MVEAETGDMEEIEMTAVEVTTETVIIVTEVIIETGVDTGIVAKTVKVDSIETEISTARVDITEIGPVPAIATRDTDQGGNLTRKGATIAIMVMNIEDPAMTMINPGVPGEEES